MILCGLALGDVGHNADHAVSLSIGRTSDDLAVASKPKSRAVGPYHAVFRGKRVLLVCKFVEFMHQMTVVRVQCRPIFVFISPYVAAPIGKVEAEQGHAFFRPEPCLTYQIGLPSAHSTSGQGGPIKCLALTQ